MSSAASPASSLNGGLSAASVPIGLISVMPQAWRATTPISLNALIIERGIAEPPQTTNRRCGSFSLLAAMWLSSISQTVGTPAVWVTFSVSRSSKTEAPSSLGPGITSLVPIDGAENAMPQLLAWNSGTTGSIVSLAQAPSESPVLAISACSTLERCEYNTPLGSPVVPDV